MLLLMRFTVCKETISNYIFDHCATTTVAINMINTSFDSLSVKDLLINF